METNNFYKTQIWKELKFEAKKRDKFCVRCEAKRRLSAHHMIPREDGGPDTLTNLVTLCEDCHDFVEIKGFTNRAQIIGSYPIKQKKEKYKVFNEYCYGCETTHVVRVAV